MLDTTSLEKISEVLGISTDDLKTKLTSEKEEAIEIPKGSFFTEQQLTSRDGNKFTEFKKDYEEQVVKKFRNDLELDFEGKSFENLFGSYKEKLKGSYSKDSTERVKELESDLQKVNDTLLQTETDLKQQISTLQYSNTIQGVKNDLLTVFPKETTIPNEDVMTLFLSKYKVKQDENGQTYLEDASGNAIKDKTASYVNHKDIFQSFVEPYVKTPAGRGGGNEAGAGTANNEDDFMSKWSKESGKPVSSREGVNALLKYREEQKQ